MSVHILEQGQRVSDRQNGAKYEVVRQIPSGSYSSTYVVANTAYPSIEHILKINLASDDIDEAKVSQVVRQNSKVFDRDARTDNEIVMLTRLNHPHIVQIADVIDIGNGYRGIITQPIRGAMTLRELIAKFGSSQNYSYLNSSPDDLHRLLSMELQAGRSSAPVKYEDMPRTMDEVLEKMGSKTYSGMFSVFHAFMKLFPQACEVINYLLDQHISHRDIGPQNILIDTNLNLHLLDFGIAFPNIKHRSPDEKPEYHSIAGGVFYRDPFMFEAGEYPFRGDLWSWGLVFHELLSGRHLITGKPWENSSREEMNDFFSQFRSFWLKDCKSKTVAYDKNNPAPIPFEYVASNLDNLVNTSFQRIETSFRKLAEVEGIPLIQELEFVPDKMMYPTETDDDFREDSWKHLISTFNDKAQAQSMTRVVQKFDFYLIIAMDFLSTRASNRTANIRLTHDLSVGLFDYWRLTRA